MSAAITAVVVGAYLTRENQKKQQQAAADAQAQALGYQDAAQQKTIEEQQRQFDLTREDTRVQREVGDKALNYLAGQLIPGEQSQTSGRPSAFSIGRGGFVPGAPATPTAAPQGQFMPRKFEMGDFTADPGYEFRRDEGAKARVNALGAGGMKLSGRAQKELERYGQDYGSAEYGKVYARELGEFQQLEADKQNYLARQMQLAGFGGQGINTATSAGTNAANVTSNAYMNAGNNRSNIATGYGADTANITGQANANYSNAIMGGIQNYLALQQQRRQQNLFMSQPSSYTSGDDYGPSTDYYRRQGSR